MEERIEKYLPNKLIFMISLFLIFGAIAVWGSISPGSSIQVDNYYTGSGEEGQDFNLVITDKNGDDYNLTFESGLLVSTEKAGVIGFPNESLNDGLVFGYSFDHADDTSTKVVDVVRGKYNLTTVSGTPVNTCMGLISNGLDLDIADYIHDSINWTEFGTQKITICLWFYATATSGNDRFQFKTTGTDALTIYRNDGLHFQHSLGGGQEYLTETMGATQWYHQCVRGNHSQGSGNLFLNGTERTDASSAGTNSLDDLSGSINTYIGYSGSESWDGVLDEIYIWNRSLDDSEIEALYNNGEGITYS